MHQKAFFLAVMAVGVGVALAACATGRMADGGDSGTRRDGAADVGLGNDGSTKDTSTPQKDSSTPIQDGSTCNLTVCGTLCVDTTIDDNNCGQCNNACPSGSSCSSSTCQCSGGMTLCSSTCVDTTSDNSNCGQCNHACTGSTTCISGTCQTQASGVPPQGSCSHSLCDLNDDTALYSGCDPSGCVNSVCSNDSYCCTDYWDSLCVGEVVTYCSPYSC